MEAVLERKTGTSFRPVQQPLTYEILQQYKREQQRLIAAGLIEKPKITDDVLTLEECAEFDNGRSVEEVFNDIANRYGF